MKRIRCLLLCLLCLLVCVACKRKENEPLLEDELEVGINWKTEGFKISEQIEQQQSFWTTEYVPWNYQQAESYSEGEQLSLVTGTFATCVRDGKIYRIHSVVCPPNIHAVRWVLEIFDTETCEIVSKEFSYQQLGQEDSWENFIVAMDVIDEEHFVFEWVELAMNADGMVHQTADKMIYINQNEVEYTIDLWDMYLQKGIAKEEFTDYITLAEGYCVCDDKGNIYVKAGITNKGFTELYVIDRGGNTLLEYHTPAHELLGEPMRTEAGDLIYPVYDNEVERYQFLWADTATGQMHSVGEINDKQNIHRLFGLDGNNIYYENDTGIVRWNIGSGNRTLVFDYQEAGISKSYCPVLVLRCGKIPMLWLSHKQDNIDWVAKLDTKPQEENTVRVVDMVYSNPGSRQVSECVSYTMREDLNKRFSYEKGTSDEYRTRIMAELAEGKGPDILYVSRADMEMLYEKGLLLDVREFISQETYDKLLPGVIGLGTIDNTFVGIAGNVTAATLAVPSSVWTKNSWDLADIIELMNSGRMESSVYYAAAEAYYAPLAVIRLLTQYSMENSFLIDWKNRESHFDDERFINLLEVTNVRKDTWEEDVDLIFSGGKHAVFLEVNSPYSVLEIGSDVYSKNCSLVGFPTRGTCGNYLDTKGYLVINANTQNVEKIGAYIECFLDENIQKIGEDDIVHPTLSVLKITMDEVEELPEGGYMWRGQEVEVAPDGTTPLDKAKTFLEECIPAPKQYPVLDTIFFEELAALYAGDKSSRQVAENIDNRVQIYLDEQ